MSDSSENEEIEDDDSLYDTCKSSKDAKSDIDDERIVSEDFGEESHQPELNEIVEEYAESSRTTNSKTDPDYILFKPILEIGFPGGETMEISDSQATEIIISALTQSLCTCQQTDLPFPTYYSLAGASQACYNMTHPPIVNMIAENISDATDSEHNENTDDVSQNDSDSAINGNNRNEDFYDARNEGDSLDDGVSALENFNRPSFETLMPLNVDEQESDENWKVICSSYNKEDDYFGCIFVHKIFNFAVIAHRGTDPKKRGALEACLNGVLLNRKESQVDSACTFTAFFNEALDKVYKQREDLCRYRVSIVGHSLGGWLAQAAVFSSKYLKPCKVSNKFIEIRNNLGYHFHCVAFDSPGAKNMLNKFAKPYDKEYYNTQKNWDMINDLDITVIYIKPNFVNIVNEQVGLLLKLDFELDEDPYKDFKAWFAKAWIDYRKSISNSGIWNIEIESHKVEHFVSGLKTEPKLYEIVDWPLFIRENYNSSKKKNPGSLKKFWMFVKGLANIPTLFSLGNELKSCRVRRKKAEFKDTVVLFRVFNQNGLELIEEVKIFFSWFKHLEPKDVPKICTGNLQELFQIEERTLKVFIKFNEKSLEINNRKYISVINDVTKNQIVSLRNAISQLPNVFHYFLLKESRTLIKEFESKYLKVKFKLDSDLYKKLTLNTPPTLYFDNNYPNEYIRLHVLSVLRSKAHKIIMVTAEQLNNLAEFNFVQRKEGHKHAEQLLIVDCLTTKTTSTKSVPEEFKIVHLERGSDKLTLTNLSLNLTDEFLESEFRQNEVTFQGRKSTIEKVFPQLDSVKFEKWFEKLNSSLLMQLFEKESKVEIGKEPPCNFDIEARYIPCAEEISIKDFKIILHQFCDSSIFVVSGNFNKFKEEFDNWQSNQSLKFINEFDKDKENSIFKKYCREFSNKFVYLLQCPNNNTNNNMFVFIRFFHSSLYKPRKFMLSSSDENVTNDESKNISEVDFIKITFLNSKGVKVLLDQPGMGKSTTLNAMCKDYFNKNDSDWVVFVDLKSINFEIAHEHTPESFLFALLNLEYTSEPRDLTRLAIQYRLENCEKNLNIFLDAFDEITFRGETNKTEKTDNSLKAQKKNFLNFLALFKKKFPTVKVIMTSRIHERDNFWRNFEFYNFLNIDKSFLFNNWDAITRIFYDKSLEETDVKLKQIDLKNYSTDLIGEAEKKLGTDLRFLGFPLHLRMLIEINIKHVVGFVSNKCSLPSVQNYSILKIFEQYIQTKYEIQGRKDGITSVKYLEPFIQKSEKRLSLLAFMNNPRIFFPLGSQKYFRRWVKGDDFKNIKTMANHNETELLSTGIIQKIERYGKYVKAPIIVTFNHKLFEQYYSTKKWFEIIRSHLLNPTFYKRENVCSFNEESHKYLSEFSEYFLVDLIQQDKEVQSKLLIKPYENVQFRLCMEQLTLSGGDINKKHDRIYTFLRTFPFFPFFDILYGDLKYYIPVQTPFSTDAIEIQTLTLYLHLSSARESKRWGIVRDILQFSIRTFKKKIRNQLWKSSIQDTYHEVARYIYDNKTLRFLYKFYKREEFKIPGFLIKLLKTSEEIKSRFLRYHIDILMTFLAPGIFVNDSCQENNIIVKDFEHACIQKLKTKDYHIAVYDCSETKVCNIISEYVERLALIVASALSLYEKYGSWEEFIKVLREIHQNFHENERWKMLRFPLKLENVLDELGLSEFHRFNSSVKSLLSNNKEYELHFSELYGWRFEYKVLLKKLISEIRPHNHMVLKAEIDEEAEIDEVFSGEFDEQINTLLRVQTTSNAFNMNMNPQHYDMLCDVIMDNKSHSYLNYFQRLKKQFPFIKSSSILNLSYEEYEYYDRYDHDYEVPDNNQVSDEDVGVTIPFSVIPPFPYNNNASI